MGHTGVGMFSGQVQSHLTGVDCIFNVDALARGEGHTGAGTCSGQVQRHGTGVV